MSSSGASGSVSKAQQQLVAEVRKSNYWRKIKTVSDLYLIGDSLLPDDEGFSISAGGPTTASSSSGSSDKYCKLALRKRDSLAVVVKGRHKLRGFKDEEELEDWLFSMSLMYHVTHSSGSASGTPGSATASSPKSGAKAAQAALPEGKIPHVAQMLDLLEDQNWYYAVMERVHGRDMFDFFVEERLGSHDKAGAVARNFVGQIALALNSLHAKGIVHRDLKFENIVVLESGSSNSSSRASSRESAGNAVDATKLRVKIVDFDTCEIAEAARIYHHVLGTDQYIAPEVYAGTVTPACDLWALGVMLYTLMTGTLPFHNALFDDEPGENWVGNPKMEQIRRRLKLVKIDWSHPNWGTGGSCADKENNNGLGVLMKTVCKRLLTFEAERRISTGELLREIS